MDHEKVNLHSKIKWNSFQSRSVSEAPIKDVSNDNQGYCSRRTHHLIEFSIGCFEVCPKFAATLYYQWCAITKEKRAKQAKNDK